MATSSTNGAETEEVLANVPTIKAYKNNDFLASGCARPIRILCELQEPAKRLSDLGVENYFLFLGSHALMHPDERKEQVEQLERKIKQGGPRDELEALSAKLRYAKGLEKMDKYYLITMDLSLKLAQWNKERAAQGLPHYHVLTGGGPGIMEAANRGASEAGMATLGFGSSRPEWGQMNKYVSEQGAFEFHYMFMRKFWMAYKCMGLVVLPGGYGTLDELFEMLQMISAKKINHRMPIILLGKEHWKKAVNWDYLVETQMLTAQSVELVKFMDTADEAFAYMKEQVLEADRNDEHGQLEGVKRRRLLPRKSNESAI